MFAVQTTKGHCIAGGQVGHLAPGGSPPTPTLQERRAGQEGIQGWRQRQAISEHGRFPNWWGPWASGPEDWAAGDLLGTDQVVNKLAWLGKGAELRVVVGRRATPLAGGYLPPLPALKGASEFPSHSLLHYISGSEVSGKSQAR